MTTKYVTCSGFKPDKTLLISVLYIRESIHLLCRGGGYKRFKVLVQQGPGVFTPTIINRIDGLETPALE
jgi:hypothetical protein